MEVRINIRKGYLDELGRNFDKLIPAGYSLIDVTDAMAFIIKCKHVNINKVNRYNPSKIRRRYLKMYGVAPHYETIEKYITIAEKLKIITIKNGTLIIEKFRSAHKDRNYTIVFEKDCHIKSLGREISQYIFSSSMKTIGYIEHLIEIVHNPKSFDQYKAAERRIRRLRFDIDRFENRGISYDTLSKRYRVSRSYVSSMINKCEDSKILRRMKDYKTISYENASKTFGNIKKIIHTAIDEFSQFSYWFYDKCKDILRLIKVCANRYVYNPTKKEELCYVSKSSIIYAGAPRRKAWYY